jgi:tRNA A-37 threonylcarbamoyl transferase component Bud32/membrane-associated phospholipid phosphatase
MVEVPLKAAETSGRRGRLRRPSGEPPPLPRQLERWDWIRLALCGAVLLVYIILLSVQGSALWLDRVDRWLQQPIIDARTAWLTDIAEAVEKLASPWAIHIMRWTAFAVFILTRRFRSLIVFLAALATASFVASGLVELFGRARPYGVEILGRWSGYSHPSLPIVALSSTLCGVCLLQFPRGKPRQIAEVVSGFVIVAVGLSRIYLGSDHPSDVVFGVLLTVTIVAIVCRVLAPEEAFPVVYRTGNHAHLALDGHRADAIRTAISEQLGLDVAEIKPFGLAGSAGSSPMRLTLADDPHTRLFAKLYARQHLRSDRNYKLGREILYGRLEDESAFSTVRRLVQYEDYMMRVMLDAGMPVVHTYGIVEITPEREYLIVTDFLDGAQEIGDPEVVITDDLIDQALHSVRLMWDTGIAHRDIKPANLMVCYDKLFLIDVAFGQIRPSAWREAVDLANMMLVLALKTNAQHVYERACEVFTPDEIAEAFAATHGITSPTQLRSYLHEDGRPLLDEFRELAPPRDPIPIQRWTLRRVALLAAVVGAALLLLTIVVTSLLTVPA